VTARILGPAVAALVLASSGLACGYQRLDRVPRTAAWMKKGETVRLARFRNTTRKLGIEERFTKALENRIVAASPWTLVSQGSSSRWVLQGTLEKYEVRPLGLSLGTGGIKASAGTASRIEVVVVASMDLLDGQTGALLVHRPGLTFSNQYRLDQNFASFDNRELLVVESLADDFAESFLTQLLEAVE
jgi:Lipopolysaccharide-assembly